MENDARGTEGSDLSTQRVLRSLADACDPRLPTPYRIDIGVAGLYDVTCRVFLSNEEEFVPIFIHIEPEGDPRLF